MGTSVRCELAIYEGEIVLAVVVGMGEGCLQLVALEVDDVVMDIVANLALQKVIQTFLGIEGLLVECEGESLVQVGVVPQPLFYKIEVEGILAEKLLVRHKLDEYTVALLGA